MRALIFITSLLLLTSCYTKNQAIKKFCVPAPTNIDSSWKINGEVVDSPHTGTFEINDSCGLLKQLYDSLINSGKFVNDTSVKQNDTPAKNNASRATKWAVLYNDSVFTVKFRIAPNGKAQVDVVKHERKIPYQAQANFKTVVTSPCPPPAEPPWWEKFVSVLQWFALGCLFGIVLTALNKR